MKRAIRRFVSTLNGPRRYIFYISLILICVVAICIAIYAQFFYKYADTDVLMIGNIGSEKTAEEIALLKTKFNELFENKLYNENDNIQVDKKDYSMNIVYTNYNLVNEDENYYSVNVQIPMINIDSQTINEINSKIKTEFYDKAYNIMRKTEGNTVYTVSWVGYINGDILSLAIKSSLKEEGKAERVGVRTYNYDLKGDKEVSLVDLINLKEMQVNSVQSTINSDIKQAYTNAKIIAAEYGTLYERDLSSDIYKVENAENFFLTQDGNVYVVYAYGNVDYTNEMDIIIF